LLLLLLSCDSLDLISFVLFSVQSVRLRKTFLKRANRFIG
jgi:hypothetical protein